MKKALSLLLTLALVACIAAVPAQAFGLFEDAYTLGDINGDEEVLIDDVAFLQRSMVGMKLPFVIKETAADADEDGEVTVIDATCIQRWIIGKTARLNIGKPVHPWVFDRSAAKPADNTVSENLTITRICMNHFYATPVMPLPIDYKIYGILPDCWQVGDDILCTLTNVYYDEYHVEADMADVQPSTWVPDPNVAYKPVIYLYPEQETEVGVKLEVDGELLTTIPDYGKGWQVTASPDGALTDNSGRTYPYLFWEAKLDTEYDFSTGFCVKGEDTEEFLRASLATMGLNQSETEDFLGFWLRLMKDNPYNVVSFQTSAYTDAARLDISPQPDTTICVFMAWYASDEAVDIPAQTLTPAQRNGFAAVEWGGQMVR